MSDFKRLWSEIDKRHVEAKDSQGTIHELYKLYQLLDSSEREAANGELFAALRSGTEGERYDALAILDHFHVVDALPALRELAGRLKSEASPGAPFERAKVQRIVADLENR